MPASWVALAIALVAVVPGFIAATTWARARTWRGPSNDLRTILQSLALSAVVQVILLPLTIWWIEPNRTNLFDHKWQVACWVVLSVLVVPLALGIGAAHLTDWVFPPRGESRDSALADGNGNGKLAGWRRRLAFSTRRSVIFLIRKQAPPSLWDWLFVARPPLAQFILIEFRDGKRLGGVFGPNALALTSPERQGLFLDQEWVLTEDGDFQEPVPNSAGVMLASLDGVRFVRILESQE